MKALILANIGTEHFFNNEILPACFLPLYNEMTVIERHISLLNVNGFANDDICVLFGSGGIWNIESVKSKIEKIRTKKAFVKKNNVLKERCFDSDFFDGEDLLIIEGNRVLDMATIARLRRYSEKNVLVVHGLLDPDNIQTVIAVENNNVTAIGNSESAAFPWIAFAGIARLSADAVACLKKAVVFSRPLLDAISDILQSCEIKAIKYDDLVHGMLNGGYSSELTGGSYSKLNYRLVVKKEDGGAGRLKLINEIEWLLSLPAELKPYFSEVLEYDLASPSVFYNVPYYGSRNLRENIFDGHYNADAACGFLEKLLDWLFKNVYSRKLGVAPDNWITEKHINRVLSRLAECSEKCELLGRIIEAERVEINGAEYRNIRELFTRLSGMGDFIKLLNPAYLSMIHGDLHFQNILLYNGTDTGFMLVDPRGERLGSDIYYDMGKLWHSVHAKYDFIHTDQFKYALSFDRSVPAASYSFTNTFAESVYDEIYKKLLGMVTKYDFIRNDPDWEMKALFAEAAHLCSVATFHIGKTGTADRAVVLYLAGVKLINEFFDKYLTGN
ncbi:MAG: hypothetical protein LBD49_01665 [Oscillospiraceae bacterium]|jgi:hypothetical protein|nr:hypothetical protein [Oscillospiraceae bacterium]